jgi:hypothetical protein
MSRLYVQEIFQCLPGKTEAFLEHLDRQIVPLLSSIHIRLLGAWEVQMAQREFVLIWRVDGPEAFTDEGWWLRSPALKPAAKRIAADLEAMTAHHRYSFMNLFPFVDEPIAGPAKGYKRRRLYFHEITQVVPGMMGAYTQALANEGLRLWESHGWHVEGLYRTYMRAREINWLAAYEQDFSGLFEPASWIRPDWVQLDDRPWDRKAWEWRQDWEERLMLALDFSPMQ